MERKNIIELLSYEYVIDGSSSIFSSGKNKVILNGIDVTNRTTAIVLVSEEIYGKDKTVS
jgi:hypothetical protein|tara:strand:- start:6492 stop:6671 length:180 start_codon:yes stop_codon:yes gene_type:complete